MERYPPYPYFSLRECLHREVCHNALEHGQLVTMVVVLEKLTHKIVKPAHQAKEEVGVS